MSLHESTWYLPHYNLFRRIKYWTAHIRLQRRRLARDGYDRCNCITLFYSLGYPSTRSYCTAGGGGKSSDMVSTRACVDTCSLALCLQAREAMSSYKHGLTLIWTTRIQRGLLAGSVHGAFLSPRSSCPRYPLLSPTSECLPSITIMTTILPSPPDLPRYASAPFDDADADLILRTSDNIDFRVSRFILRIASPFFASMFEVGQTRSGASGEAHENGDEVRDGCRVFPVQEDGDTLDSLLRIIYPRKDPILGDLPKVNSVIAAALKYEMEEAIALTGAELLSFTSKEASRVWAIAVRHGLEPEARAAADELLREKAAVLDDFPSEMQAVNAGAYYRLLQYLRLDGKVESDFVFCYPSSSKPPSFDNHEAGTASSSIHLPGGNHPRLPTDVVCQSSDGKEFPAHKAILAYASPVMAVMLTSLPTLPSGDFAAEGTSTGRANDPILTFEEDGATVGALVALAYPITDGYEAHFLALQEVLETVEKYEMNDAFKLSETRWLQFTVEDPLSAYLLAANHRAAEGAQQAARRLLDRAMEDYYVPFLECSPVSTYRDALLYHRACKAAAADTAQTFYADNNFNAAATMKSALCDTYNNGYYCRGVQATGGYRDLVSNPNWRNVCSVCLHLGRTIANTIHRLDSPSKELFTTLESLKGPPKALDLQCLAVSDQDRPALQTLYKALYDMISKKVEMVRIFFSSLGTRSLTFPVTSQAMSDYIIVASRYGNSAHAQRSLRKKKGKKGRRLLGSSNA